MKPYESYKDSGIDWLDQIPKHWEVKSLKHLAKINRRTLTETVDKQYQIQYIDIGNVSNTGLINEPTPMLFGEAPSRARRLVGRDEIIISTVRTYLKAVAYIEDTASNLVASTGFATLTARQEVAPRFLYYLVSAQEFIDAVAAESDGVSYPAITSTDLSQMKAWLPPFSEQQTIADFLDSETADIDWLVKQKQRQVELLQEQRLALISEAVTRGLDTAAPLKDSGVEWLGEIPAHWEVKRLKYIAHISFSNVDKHVFKNELPVQLCNYVDVYKNDFITPNLPFMEGTATASEVQKFALKTSDVLITKDSESWTDIAVPAYVVEDMENVLCGYHLAQIRPGNISGKFLFWQLNSSRVNEQYRIEARGITRYGLAKGVIENSLVLVPPLNEQQAIAYFLDHKIEQVDRLIELEQRQIELLGEQRTSLISEAVTGKIDVRSMGE